MLHRHRLIHSLTGPEHPLRPSLSSLPQLITAQMQPYHPCTYPRSSLLSWSLSQQAPRAVFGR